MMNNRRKEMQLRSFLKFYIAVQTLKMYYFHQNVREQLKNLKTD